VTASFGWRSSLLHEVGKHNSSMIVANVFSDVRVIVMLVLGDNSTAMKSRYPCSVV
jgi:hypothetical protein